MKKLAILGVTVAALLASPAIAAAPTPYTWTGCYIGGNIGLVKQDTDTVATLSFDGFSATRDLGWSDGIGLAAGGQVGCDYQMNSYWVVGVRGMFDSANITQSLSYSEYYDSTPYGVQGTDGINTKWFATAVGRIGYLPGPNMLVYVKGGAAWKHVSYSDNGCFVDDSSCLASYSGTGSATILGWDAGAGFEYALMPHLSVFAELDYMGFPSNTTTIAYTACETGPGCINESEPHSYTHDMLTILVGVNLRSSP